MSEIKTGLEVVVSDDHMEASLLLPAAAVYSVHGDEIISLLKSHGIQRGISKSAIIEFLKNPVRDTPVVIARGRLPIKGESSQTDLKYTSPSKELVPKCLASGQVDFRNLDIIHIVKENELLATKIPARPGTAGYDVYGRPVPAPNGDDLPLKVGANVGVSEDGMEARSLIEGAVTFEGERIAVTPVVEIAGDVDFSVGNINFPGTVIVRGSVLGGFTVVAGEDVSISGTVEAATIQCKGNLTVKGGVLGQGRARLEAGADFAARFINEATVEARGNILTNGAILHSQVSAGGQVLVSGRDGSVAGGRVQALSGITCESAGSNMGTKTQLILGYEDDVPKKIRQAAVEIEKMEKDMQKLQQDIEHFDPNRMSREDYLRKMERMPDMEQEILAAQERRNELKNIIETARKSVIKIKGPIFPGVSITIDDVTMKTDNALKALTFYREGGKLQSRSAF